MVGDGFLLILMYNQLFTGEPADRYSVPVNAFRRQMGMLAARGFRSVVPETLGRETCTRQVMITFDDGYASDLAYALPVLSGLGFRGVSFITTSYLGRPGYLSWEQCAELGREGFSIQSHTHTHPLLGSCSGERLRYELRHPKELIEERLGSEVIGLSLPGGSLPKGIVEKAAQEGYRCVFSSIPGIHRLPADMDGVLRRLRVDSRLSLEAFERVTEGEAGMYRGIAAGYYLRRAVKRFVGAGAYHRLWLRLRKSPGSVKETLR
jgi:peptidoglycan/xylan/chitin deacetylase (PgdA/CDA1 family)